LEEGFVRLESGETKNDRARVIPLIGEIREMLKLQRDARDANWPNCHPTRLFHDLRRTGVRNLIRATVPERVAMTISGHKTRSVFDRYNIVSERDLQEAANRLNGYLQDREFQRRRDNTVTLPEVGSPGKEQPTAGKFLN
jgi:integrase